MLAVQITAPTLIEGFTFTGGATITVMARACTDALVLRDLVLRSTRGDGEKVLLAQDCPQSSSGPQLINSFVDTGQNEPAGQAVLYDDCGGLIQGNRMIGDTRVLEVAGSGRPDIIGNHVTQRLGGGFYGAAIYGGNARSIVGNRVDVGVGAASSTGIEAYSSNIINNIVCGQTADSETPERAVGGSNNKIINNTLCRSIVGNNHQLYNNVIVRADSGTCVTGSGHVLGSNAFVNCTGQTATNGNLIFASAAEAGVPGFPADLHLSDDAPVEMRTGGINTTSYGVIADIDGKARTCEAGECYSRGAYEW